MDKFAIYYGTRAFFYQALYGFLFGIALGVLASILVAIAVKCHIVQSLNMKSFAFIGLFFVLCILVLAYFQVKLSLKKMFFKPYKKFVITTKIEQIPSKMVFIFWGMNSLPGFLITYLIDFVFLKNFMQNIETYENLIKYSLLRCLPGLLICFCLTYVVSIYLVHKHATVTPKQSVV